MQYFLVNIAQRLWTGGESNPGTRIVKFRFATDARPTTEILYRNADEAALK